MRRQLLYLHGFASSPRSKKAQFLGRHFADAGVELVCPDLNEPDFSTLTVTRMLDQVEQSIRASPPGPVALLGSSLGGFVALHLSERLQGDRHHPIERLVLLAPALEFGTTRMNLGRGAIEHWRNTGWLDVPHFAIGETRSVHYDLFEDARQYRSLDVECTVPTLILQGKDDDVVDPEIMKRFSLGRPAVRVVMLEDGHQLAQSLDRLWDEIRAFLE